MHHAPATGADESRAAWDSRWFTSRSSVAGLVKAERLGGSRVMGPGQAPGGPVIGLFTDPEEDTIGLVAAA